MVYQTWMGPSYKNKSFFKDECPRLSWMRLAVIFAVGVGLSFALPDSPHLKNGGNASNNFNPIQIEHQNLEIGEPGN